MWLCLFWGYRICSERLFTHSHGFMSHTINTNDDMEVKKDGDTPSGSPPERARLLLGPPPTGWRWRPEPLTRSSLFKRKQRPWKLLDHPLPLLMGPNHLKFDHTGFQRWDNDEGRVPYTCGELQPSQMMCFTPRFHVTFNAGDWDCQWWGGKM